VELCTHPQLDAGQLEDVMPDIPDEHGIRSQSLTMELGSLTMASKKALVTVVAV
jgi:hypothetical protein